LWFSSLRTRLIVFLTVALLPIGGVAVYQTVRVIQEVDRLAQSDVLARTTRAASELQRVLQRAFGAAEALGAAAVRTGAESGACDDIMRRFVDNSLDYSFAGFISADGLMACNNGGRTIDYGGTPNWEEFIADPKRTAYVRSRGAISEQPVIIAFIPIRDPDTNEFLGAQAVSTPSWLTDTLMEVARENVSLVLIAPDGEILAASRDIADPGPIADARLAPADLDVPPGGRIVDFTGDDGETRPAALVRLIPDTLYVAGFWEGDEPRGTAFGGRATPVFPILMWAASLIVAYLAVSSLVLGNLSRLSDRMRRFRSDRHGVHFLVRPDAPQEFVTIAESYNAMVDRIAEDHDTLTANVREKELLLREVHHRVKNNLQLIASILNMQIRSVRSPEARRILTRVQDRVMSLSTIHKALYTGDRLDVVDADALLTEIIDGVLNNGLPSEAVSGVRVELDPLRLDPDRAVPLSLLATEAMTNATKHLGTPPGGTPRLEATLRHLEDGTVVFTVVNSRGEGKAEGPDGDGTTLGNRLIDAFASQLEGRTEVQETDDEYRLVLTFHEAPPAAGGAP
jgi:two-component sensor histidine kinase